MECDKMVLFFKSDGEWNVRFEEPVESQPCLKAGGGEPQTEAAEKTAAHTAVSGQQVRDSSLPLVSNDDGASREEADTFSTDETDASDDDSDEEYSGECEKCTNPHDGKLVMQRQFPYNIDRLYRMLFTDSQFSSELLAARNTLNFRQSPWEEQDGVKCRQLRYTLRPTGFLGPMDVHLTETQVLNKCSKRGALYSIECSTDSAGVPYEDCFSVCVHYCLQRVTRSSTLLSFYGHVKYRRPIFLFFVKSAIEKDSFKGMDEFCCQLESKLNSEAGAAAPAARKPRKRRRATETSADAPAPPALASLPAPPAPPDRATLPTLRWWLAVVLMFLAFTLVYTLILYWDLLNETWSDLPLF